MGRFSSKTYAPIRRLEFRKSVCDLRQQASVEDYIQQFEYVAGMILGLPEQAYVRNVINGLKEEIKRRIKVHDTQELVCTMENRAQFGGGINGFVNSKYRGQINSAPSLRPTAHNPIEQ